MEIYRGLASSVSALPEGVIRGVYAWAKKHEDVDLLTQLVVRTDLPVDILAEFKKEKVAKICVAYFSREDIQPAELEAAAKKDKRAIVLEAIARSTKTPPETLRILGDSLHPKINLALLSNVNAPAETLTKVLRRLWNDNHLTVASSSMTLGDLPHVHNIAVLNLDALIQKVYHQSELHNYLGAKVIKSDHLTKEAELLLVDALVVQPINDLVKTNSKSMLVRRIPMMVLMLASRTSLSTDALKLLQSTIDFAATQNVLDTQSIQILKEATQTRSAATETAKKTLELLQAAKVATSPEEINTLTTLALHEAGSRNVNQLRSGLAATFDALALNVHTDETTILTLLPYVSGPHSKHPVTDILVETYKGNDTVLTEILSQFDTYLDGILPKLSDPTAVLDTLASRISSTPSYGQYNRMKRWHRLMQLGHLSTKGLWHLPVSQTGATNLWAHPDYQTSYKLVEDLMYEHLGENLAAWEIFSTLAENSHKPLGELLETAALLTGKS